MDCSNNIFAGMAYFLLGYDDEGGYEEAVSKTILAAMKKGGFDEFTLFALKDDLNEIISKPRRNKPK